MVNASFLSVSILIVSSSFTGFGKRETFAFDPGIVSAVTGQVTTTVSRFEQPVDEFVTSSQ